MKLLKDRLIKHWKTTLVGFATSVLMPLIDKAANGEVSTKILVLSGISFLLGWVLKDTK